MSSAAGASSPGGTGTTGPDWTDPNYWSGWNNTVGSLGSAVGTWYQAFSNGGQQPIQYQGTPPGTNNTALWVGLGVIGLLLVVILVVLFRKN